MSAAAAGPVWGKKGGRIKWVVMYGGRRQPDCRSPERTEEQNQRQLNPPTAAPRIDLVNEHLVVFV